MAEVRMYRTYRWTHKNPVIDKCRTIAQDEGLYKDLKALHEITGVAVATFNGWWHGDTVNPQHGTIMALLTGLGYEETFTKVKTIDIAAERNAGKKWLEARAKRKKQTNGSGRKRTAK